ncbi:alpha beta-hydrolase [Lecanosticta acicola]|uniref:Kynurenine formamidase n=1 Tax=Lecanosticta acicola TaxID=111012 RepID=A0AAI8Z5J9_9PEZI|nr:alpha beta-hydrolase [Lecanosticta acicola]
MVTDDWPQFRKDIHYSDDSRLNTLQTCIPRPTSAKDSSRIWVLYVHGGAWFDPDQNASTFDKAQDILLRSPIAEYIAGFASINYRLSPAPSHPTNPSNPADPARNAKHPDHINDVLAAILHLQETYRFQDRYVLAGHSCGACLVLQVAMKRFWGSQYESTLALELNVTPPLAIVGIEGLYDLPALVKNHSNQPLYRNFTESAFGADQNSWAPVSPTHSNLNETWQDGKLVVLAHSRSDELVEWEQPELMMKSLKAQAFKDSGDRRFKLMELHGTHDQVWKEGKEVANAIEFTIREVLKMK